MLRRLYMTGFLLVGLGEPTHMAPSEFDALIKQERESNATIVRAVGLKAN
jgi:hypothetical protein